METVLFRVPGIAVQKLEGTWEVTTFSEIKKDRFFVTSFSKDKCFQFQAEKATEHITVSNFADSNIYAESKDEYVKQLVNFRDKFKDKGIKKAIYSRVIQTPFDKKAEDLFDELCTAYPTAFVYLISSKFFGTWVGATPETLLSYKNGAFSTMSLAGTKKEVSTEWTNKEIEEQEFVTEFIKAELKKMEVTNLVISPTHTTYTGSVYHLKTDLSFQTGIERWNNVANALHPTPAVCGIPRDKAYNHILESEKHNREFYTGIIGFQKENELQAFVNLRCLQVHENVVSLYVGGGITAQSKPEAEFLETTNKAQTLLKVINQLNQF